MMFDPFDFITLSPHASYDIAVWLCFFGGISSLYYAFAASQDASFKCYLAFFRLLYRWAMGFGAIIMFNFVAYLLDHPDRTPSGPGLLVYGWIVVITTVSALRHVQRTVPIEKTWHGVGKAFLRLFRPPVAPMPSDTAPPLKVV
jgi:hypothetical protein